MDYSHLNTFKIYKLKFVCRAINLLQEGPFWGSALHGVFGQSLRKNLCITNHDTCTDCAEKDNCSYQRIFYPQLPQTHSLARKYADMPQPFIIQKDMFDKVVFLPGELFSFGFNVVGNAIEDFVNFQNAFIEAGKKGIGRLKAKFEVIQILVDKNGNDNFDMLNKGEIPQPLVIDSIKNFRNISKLNMWFVSPIHLKEKGNVCYKPSLQLMVERIYERLNLLNHFYCDGIFQEDAGIVADEIHLKHQLNNYAFGRFSNRHEKHLKLNGLMGNIELQGKIEPIMSLLILGSLVNFGKMATLGLGHYRLEYGR